MQKGAASSLISEFTRFDNYKDAAATGHEAWTDAVADSQKDPPPDGAAEAEQEAEDDLRAALDAALRSSRSLLVALKSFRPADEKGAAHKSFIAYCGMLLPTARAFVAKYQRESEAPSELEREDDEEDND